jgi:hypothetical protein
MSTTESGAKKGNCHWVVIVGVVFFKMYSLISISQCGIPVHCTVVVYSHWQVCNSKEDVHTSSYVYALTSWCTQTMHRRRPCIMHCRVSKKHWGYSKTWYPGVNCLPHVTSVHWPGTWKSETFPPWWWWWWIIQKSGRDTPHWNLESRCFNPFNACAKITDRVPDFVKARYLDPVKIWWKTASK